MLLFCCLVVLLFCCPIDILYLHRLSFYPSLAGRESSGWQFFCVFQHKNATFLHKFTYFQRFFTEK